MNSPILTISRAFMIDFVEAQPPCFALGMIDIEGDHTGFLAMRPKQPMPSQAKAAGFNLGHALLGFDNTVLCQFVFDFHDNSRYSALVNPAIPAIRSIIKTMVERGEYMFFNLDPDDNLDTFRAADRNLAGLADNLPRMQAATTTDEEYEKGIQAFRKNPDLGLPKQSGLPEPHKRHRFPRANRVVRPCSAH